MIKIFKVSTLILPVILLCSVIFTTTNTFDISKTIEHDDFSIDLAKYFLKLAGFGYCYIEGMKSEHCCPELLNDEGWTLVAFDKISTHNFNFAILRHDKHKKIVVTFPGTRGKTQLLSEIYCNKGIPLKDEPNQKIFHYFYYIYQEINEKIRGILKEIYKQYDDYQYIFTGHSLGGAMATIFSLDSVKYNNLQKKNNSPVLITYGQPRTGNDIFANEVMKYIPIVWRVVRQGDLVATMPKCRSWFLSQNCETFLENKKFTNKTVQLTEQQQKYERDYYYAYHIGGLKLFDKDMNSYKDCGNEYGDNHPDYQCHVYLTVDLKKHSVYFDQKVSKMCRQIPTLIYLNDLADNVNDLDLDEEEFDVDDINFLH